MTYFAVHTSDGVRWHPSHIELQHIDFWTHPDEPMTEEQIRERLFSIVDAQYPGKYSLSYDIDMLRAEAFARIDSRSDRLIAAGFDFDGVRFSSSLEAQIRYTNMLSLADMMAPLDVNSLDDASCRTLQTPDDLRAFCLAALAHVKGVVDSGSTQKEIVRGLQTAEELVDFVDPRPPPTDVPVEPGQEV
jgi:hypothetical protein